MRNASLRYPRLRGWLRRYLPAEACGTSAAVVAALAVGGTAGHGSAVVAASWAEAAGFYAFVILRELRRGRSRRPGAGAVVVAVRDVIAEFGAAEAADTIFVRPLLMYAFVGVLGGLLPGVLAGKLAADAVFYALAVPAYELLERSRS